MMILYNCSYDPKTIIFLVNVLSFIIDPYNEFSKKNN